jgi:16S rRNA (guanine(966)-N(2))-methyltransferase RsmD
MKSLRGNVRPTTGKVLASLFNILDASGDIRGARFLDLFSGTGEVTITAVRRGAASALAVESSHEMAGLIKDRLSRLYDEKNARCVRADVRRALPRLAKDGAVFDVIFADPPYGMGWSETLPVMIAEHRSILAPGGVFVLERSSRDSAAASGSVSEIFAARDDRIYGDTVLSIYRKIIAEE